MKTHYLLHLSDCHLMPEPGALFRGVDPHQRLQQVLAHVQALPQRFDLLLLSGDLVHHGGVADYRQLLQLLQRLRLPLVWLPGNHDELPAMRGAGAEYWRDMIELGGWRLHCLDSTHDADGRGSGALSEATLARLESRLTEASDSHHLLALHHHPLPTGTEWQDRIMLTNAADFWQRLQGRHQVRGVLCGHVHQACHWQHNQLPVWSAPSTAVQFRPETEQAETEHEAPAALPGYRWYALHDDGRIDAHLERVPVEQEALHD